MVNIDGAFDKAGGLGIFQLVFVAVSSLFLAFVAANMGASIFQAMVPKTRCKSPFEELLREACPLDFQKLLVPKVDGLLSKCTRFNYTNLDAISLMATGNSTEPVNATCNVEIVLDNATGLVDCTEWEFDRSVMRNTIVTDFDLVCGYEWAGYFSQSALMIGVGVGSILTGYISDRIGRRHALLVVSVGATLCGTLLAFTESFLVYSVVRTFLGIFAYSPFLVLFVHTSEMTVPRYRSVVAQALEMAFPLGFMYLSLAAYLLREWRNLQFAIAIPFVAGAAIWWFVPESPRWLCRKSKEKEALEVIKKVAKINRRKHVHLTNEKELEEIKANDTTGEERIIIEVNAMKSIFGRPHLRAASFKMFYGWFAVSCVYYALTFNAADLDGDPFRNLCMTSAGEMVAAVLTIPLVNFCGRRATWSASQFMAGAMCILLAFIPSGGVLAVATLGKFTIAISFCVMFIHANEIYPTAVRNFGLGLCSTMARVGGVVSPIIAMTAMLSEKMPYIIFGAIVIVAGLLALTLPETNGIKLAQTVQEGEDFIRNDRGILTCGRKKQNDSEKPDELIPSTPEDIDLPSFEL